VAQEHRQQKHAVGNNADLHKALSHPLRYRILMALGEITASPTELAELLEEDFQKVCEQVRILKKAGFIEVVDTDSRHGGTQFFYRATVRPLLDAEEWAQLPRVAREGVTVAIFRRVVNDGIAAIESGDFDAHPHRALLQKPMVVDEQGFREADEAALRHLAELTEIQSRSAARLIGRGEQGIRIKTVTIVHKAAEEDQDPGWLGKTLSSKRPNR
jgi:DNA-binding transcriptional ArsR family regulator